MQFWKRPYCPQRQSFGACCQASTLFCFVCCPHCNGKASGFNWDCTTFRCAWQSGLGCHDWEGKRVLVWGHFKFKQVWKYLEVSQIWTTKLRKSLPLSGCLTVSKDHKNTTEEEVDHKSARMESMDEIEEMFCYDVRSCRSLQLWWLVCQLFGLRGNIEHK